MRPIVLTGLLALALATPTAGQDDFVDVAVAAVEGLRQTTDPVEWVVSLAGFRDVDPEVQARRMTEVSRRTGLAIVDHYQLREPQIALRFWALDVQGDTATLRVYLRRAKTHEFDSPNSLCTALLIRVEGAWTFERCTGGFIG